MLVDLVGGYYDASDNVKYGFPMAFTVTMLAWGSLHYIDELAAAGELDNNVRDSIRWVTDYLIKASATSNQLWVHVNKLTSQTKYPWPTNTAAIDFIIILISFETLVYKTNW